MGNNKTYKELTSNEHQCGIGLCPGIFTSKISPGVYLIVGNKVFPSKYGLSEKVGENEVLMEIPKGLLEATIQKILNE